MCTARAELEDEPEDADEESDEELDDEEARQRRVQAATAQSDLRFLDLIDLQTLCLKYSSGCAFRRC